MLGLRLSAIVTECYPAAAGHPEGLPLLVPLAGDHPFPLLTVVDKLNEADSVFSTKGRQRPTGTGSAQLDASAQMGLVLIEGSGQAVVEAAVLSTSRTAVWASVTPPAAAPASAGAVAED